MPRYLTALSPAFWILPVIDGQYWCDVQSLQGLPGMWLAPAAEAIDSAPSPVRAMVRVRRTAHP